MKVLVVGATGQVGSEVVRALVARGIAVRAFVRADSKYTHLRDLDGVEVSFGDLLDPETIPPAVAGVDAIIATANSVSPRRRRDFGRVETVGYPALVAAAAEEGIDRLVYLSTVPMGEADATLPLSQHHRAVEATIQASGLPFTIMRFCAFSDVWLALPGSTLPQRGMSPTLFDRPFRFVRIYRALTGRTVDRFGRMVIVGSPEHRTAFITVRDAAAFLVAALDHEATRDAIFEIGGPEALSWGEVGDMYADLLGRPVKITSLPPGIFRVLGRLLAPIAPASANILMLNYAGAVADMTVTGNELAAELGLGPLERVEIFLKERAAIEA
jgi:uncharacterized protein YbjT (DUF2867 family)